MQKLQNIMVWPHGVVFTTSQVNFVYSIAIATTNPQPPNTTIQ